jgi:phospholipid/cholesterol/gamma-HCH transport system ATP-binding protein
VSIADSSTSNGAISGPGAFSAGVSSVHHVELQSVSMHFPEAHVQALSDVSFKVRRGDIGVIIGGSGAGKTTLLRIIIGLLRPTRGAVYIDGEDIVKKSGRELQGLRVKWGMVFQYSALLDSLTVLENVALPLKEHEKLTETQRQLRVRRMLGLLDLADTEERYPNELSGGMRKRVALARALIRHPSLIVYDEPSSGLDPLTARLVDDLILRTRDRFGVTSIVITHDMVQAIKLADRLYVLDKGHLVAAGAPLELTAQPDSLAAKFFEAGRVT